VTAKRNFLLLFLFLLSPPILAEEDLLKAILANNAAARNVFRSYRTVCLLSLTSPIQQPSVPGDTSDTTSKEPDVDVGNLHSTSTIEYRVSGDSRFIRKTEQQHIDTRPDEVPRVRDFVGLINNEYSAFSVVPNEIEQHFHSSINSMSQRERILTSFLFNFDPVAMGYDTTSGTVAAIVAESRKVAAAGNYRSKKTQTQTLHS